MEKTIVSEKETNRSIFYEAPGSIASKNKKISPYHFVFKRALDIIFSAFGILVVSPILVLIAVLIKRESKGPVFYKQKRVGRFGKEFHVFKFRTMIPDERPRKIIFTHKQREQYRAEFKVDDDPRISRLGVFLRTTSLDELPQLFNILRGEMSFIGPRPVLQIETELYKNNRDLLLSCVPGLTGFWQAYGRNNITYNSGRMEMELHYVQNKSLLLDIKILCRTFISVLSRDGAQ